MVELGLIALPGHDGHQQMFNSAETDAVAVGDLAQALAALFTQLLHHARPSVGARQRSGQGRSETVAHALAWTPTP